jgi:hypothetical protein
LSIRKEKRRKPLLDRILAEAFNAFVKVVAFNKVGTERLKPYVV